jgi:hypothetical protein
MQGIVALMTDPITNEPTGVHRTYLNRDATKRERKMLGRQTAPNHKSLSKMASTIAVTASGPKITC